MVFPVMSPKAITFAHISLLPMSVLEEKENLNLHHLIYTVTAPFDADPTSKAYFASAPTLYRGLIGFHFFSLLLSSLSDTTRSILLFCMSITISSYSFTRAIGPPTIASGATWPIINPLVAPENLPSVTIDTFSPRPCPTNAAVTDNISLIPGPPLGPSYLIT